MANPKKSTSKASQNGTESYPDRIVVTAHQLLLNELRTIYWTENQLELSLPVLEKAAGSPQLKTLLNDHLEATKEHIGRLEVIFELLNEKPLPLKCNATEGLDQDTSFLIQFTKPGSMERDLAIILAAQKTEHHEIACYAGLLKLAEIMNQENIISMLEQTLSEEQEADQLLARLAEECLPMETPA